MGLRREWFLVFLSPLVLVALGVLVMQAVRDARSKQAERVAGESLYREMIETVRDRYVTEVDVDRLVYGAARGIMRELDPHCRVYSPEEWNRQEDRTAGRYHGIGVSIALLAGRLTVLEALPRSPAARAGVRDGDRILAVDGVPVPPGASVASVQDRLKGARGEALTLTLESLAGGPSREVKVLRGEAETRLVSAAMLPGASGVGYLFLESFRDTTTRQFDEHMERLLGLGLKALVFDLRGNLGGNLDDAVTLAGRFVKRGVIVTTVDRDSAHPREASGNAPYADIPLVILVDALTASASEVLAGCLQDYGRAVLVGERTYGKGVVQDVGPFASGWPGGMKLTTAHYFTPAGRCIEKSVGLGPNPTELGGLVPDVMVPMTPSFRSANERDAWYDRRDRSRIRRRYVAEVRRLLDEEDREPFDDPQLRAAQQILVDRWAGDRGLR